MRQKLRIGTSGWSYAHWDKVFYPKTTDRLLYYASVFDTVEINATFYRLPTTKTVKNWHDQVPQNFLFSVKASRYITHVKRLRDCRKSLHTFYQKIAPLKKKLGPILFQFPPSFSEDLERLENFLPLLKPTYQYAFEFRCPSWFNPQVYKILKKYRIALCFSDIEGPIFPTEPTAKFIYVRLHGPKGAYRGAYGKKGLIPWKRRITTWLKQKKQIYVYFDNDEKSYAVQDAKLLRNFF